jgi:hypothetical protein
MTVAELIEQLKQIQDQDQTVALTDGGAFFEIDSIDVNDAEIQFTKVYY